MLDDSVEVVRTRLESYRNGISGSALIINADDWARDQATTNSTLECYLRGTISSVSAMVFMEDSERGAALARERGIDAGLHLNLTLQFSTAGIPAKLSDHQRRVSEYLLRHRLSSLIFHPGLANSFEYVVAVQLEEFARLYGNAPSRIDGHHHMHLCANVLLGRLLPKETVVRRNFSFRPGEKSFFNRIYRSGVDFMLARRHRLADLFFSLPPLEPASRLERIFSAARHAAVEVETHPINPLEYQFLTDGSLHKFLGDLQVAPRYVV